MPYPPPNLKRWAQVFWQEIIPTYARDRAGVKLDADAQVEWIRDHARRYRASVEEGKETWEKGFEPWAMARWFKNGCPNDPGPKLPKRPRPIIDEAPAPPPTLATPVRHRTLAEMLGRPEGYTPEDLIRDAERNA